MGKAVSQIANIFTGSNDTRAAGQQASEAQARAAREAAAAAAFRPVGMTTRFGSSQFTRKTDPRTGMPYISDASYTAAPELAALQNQLFGGFSGGMDYANQQAEQFGALTPAAQRLFGLGEQYLATSPEEAAQRYMDQQQALLSSSRASQLAQTRAGAFGSGRSGLGVQTGTGGAPTSPELQAYYNALAQQDLALAAQADQAAQQRIGFGSSLFGTGAGLLGTQTQGITSAYSPLQTQLALSGQVEQMSQMPYMLGLELGRAQQPGQTAGAQMYGQGMAQAAQTQYGATQAANASNAQFWGGLIGAAGTAAAGGAMSDIRTKENIKLIGKTKGGHNLYSFEYKKEFKDSEYAGHGNFIGVMAQEVEKTIPNAVFVGSDGYKVVNYSLIV